MLSNIGGYRIKHDPTYIANSNSQSIPKMPIRLPLELLKTATITGLIALIAAVLELQKPNVYSELL